MLVLDTLTEMLKCPDLVESFSKYSELLVLKVLSAHNDDSLTPSPPESSGGTTATSSPMHATKQMLRVKSAEKCAAMLAKVLPADVIIRLASTTITTEPFPKNRGAIKMLNAAVEQGGREAIEPHLPMIMPGLIMVRNILSVNQFFIIIIYKCTTQKFTSKT